MSSEMEIDGSRSSRCEEPSTTENRKRLTSSQCSKRLPHQPPVQSSVSTPTITTTGPGQSRGSPSIFSNDPDTGARLCRGSKLSRGLQRPEQAQETLESETISVRSVVIPYALLQRRKGRSQKSHVPFIMPQMYQGEDEYRGSQYDNKGPQAFVWEHLINPIAQGIQAVWQAATGFGGMRPGLQFAKEDKPQGCARVNLAGNRRHENDRNLLRALRYGRSETGVQTVPIVRKQVVKARNFAQRLFGKTDLHIVGEFTVNSRKIKDGPKPGALEIFVDIVRFLVLILVGVITACWLEIRPVFYKKSAIRRRMRGGKTTWADVGLLSLTVVYIFSIAVLVCHVRNVSDWLFDWF
ncbi:hypothetical protein MN608_03688 [Microdochium nivale]|nr:hypothetical protein MN608_03688 [Microdochium nivale]